MSRATHQRGYEIVVVVVDHSDLVGVHEDPLDLLEGAVEDDMELLRVGRVPDLLQHRAVVVAERVQLVQGELDALVALGELEHLLESDQRLLVLVYHHERLPVEGLEEARICLEVVKLIHQGDPQKSWTNIEHIFRTGLKSGTPGCEIFLRQVEAKVVSKIHPTRGLF